MSYQSRSRAKSVSDVFIFEGNGRCCFADGTSSVTNYYECVKTKGAFFSDVNAVCPEIGVTGCCCSCSGVESYESNGEFYTFEGGLRVTSKCTCEEECGVFHQGQSCESLDPNTPGVCTKPYGQNQEYDVRYPYGCCHPTTNESGEVTGWNCSEVCSANECAELAPSNLSTFCPNVYYGIDCSSSEQIVGSGRMCEITHPVFQGTPIGNCSLENSCSSEDLCDLGEAPGACCVLNIIENTVECYQLTENQCVGSTDNLGNVVSIPCWGGCGTLCEVGICPEPPEPGGGNWYGWCATNDVDILCLPGNDDCPPQLPECCLSSDGVNYTCEQSCSGQGVG